MSDRVPPELVRIAFSAGLASYLDAATLTSVSVALPIWRDRFALGVWEVGSLTAGLAFAVAVGAVLGGWLGDRWGRVTIFTFDLVVFVVGAALMLAAASGPVLVLGVLVAGLAVGADVPTSLALISDAAPAWARGRLIGLTQLMWITAILVTFSIGFVVADLGFRGTRVLVAHLLLLGGLTLALRLVLSRRRQVVETSRPPRPSVVPGVRSASDVVWPLVATGGFFVAWNLAATTMGNYGTYYLVTVTGLSQRGATGLVLVTFPLALVMAAAFVRLADTAWRDRLFVAAMVLQVAAFCVGAATGGRALSGMAALIVLYSLSNVFAGEAVYRVWSQLLLPATVRATAMGMTYGAARASAAALMLAIPALIEWSGVALLWLLSGCMVVAGSAGLLITRHPRFASQLSSSSRR